MSLGSLAVKLFDSGLHICYCAERRLFHNLTLERFNWAKSFMLAT